MEDTIVLFGYDVGEWIGEFAGVSKEVGRGNEEADVGREEGSMLTGSERVGVVEDAVI